MATLPFYYGRARRKRYERPLGLAQFGAMSLGPQSPWFMTPEPRPAATLQLYCVPHAGRGATLFMPWRALLPPWIALSAVQLPGRERRYREPPLRRISAIAEALAAELQPRIDRPYALFGHSMGALISYETTRALRRRGAPLPLALFLSGRRAPTVPDDDPPVHSLSDAEFIAAMCIRYNGIPQVILDQPDMMRMLLPAMRADIEALETYSHAPGEPLPVPFFVYGGRDDTQLAAENIAEWPHLTTETCALRTFPGGHFYLQDDPAPVIETTVASLSDLMPRDRMPGDAPTAGARWDR
jgi:medium-chain acyl-[acyl-carrier-protein] hydrolase